jgi:hypothetical protein
MNTRMKTNITRGCVGMFVVAAIFSFLVVGKLVFTTGVSPEGLLLGKKLQLKNVFVPELSKESSYTIESEAGKKIDYIFVRFTDNEEKDFTYNIYTPTEILYSKHEIKQPHDGKNSLFQIINAAYADHAYCPTYRVACSGSHRDSQGNYHEDGCWCR